MTELAAHLGRTTGAVFRAHNPRWSFAPESGDGARARGGRFNPRGMAALYTCLSIEAAWAEAQHGLPAKAQPLTLCQYDVDCSDILDLRKPASRKAAGITEADLACAWWSLAYIEGAEPPTWAMARRLVAAGAAGILVPSHARHAPPGATNLVLYDWGRAPPHFIRVVDDEQRLPRNSASWSGV